MKRGNLILLIGVSSSGKSTYAKEFKAHNPDAVIIGRDYIRMMVHGLDRTTLNTYYDCEPNILKMKEAEMTRIENDLIRENLLADKVVISDNRNIDFDLLQKTIKRYYYTNITLFLLPLNKEEIKLRNSNRPDKQSDDILNSMFNKYEHTSKNIEQIITLIKENNKYCEDIVIDKNLPKAVIFDIDGTLALNINDNRNYFDMSRVDEDVLNIPVYESLMAHHKCGHKIIICSGRDSSGFIKTVEWFQKYNIPYDEMYFRELGNYEPDYVIKDSMWRLLATKYNIVCMYDDRNQVVDHARLIGLNCFQVNYGNK